MRNAIDIPHHWMKGDKMNSSYVFLCGVMWCRFGQQEAGKELLRATNSIDPDMSALAWAMLAKGTCRLRDLDKREQNLNTFRAGKTLLAFLLASFFFAPTGAAFG